MSCPECEYCCAVGLCCDAARQREALVKLFAATGSSKAECEKHADALVAAREKAYDHAEKD